MRRDGNPDAYDAYDAYVSCFGFGDVRTVYMLR